MYREVKASSREEALAKSGYRKGMLAFCSDFKIDGNQSTGVWTVQPVFTLLRREHVYNVKTELNKDELEGGPGTGGPDTGENE